MKLIDPSGFTSTALQWGRSSEAAEISGNNHIQKGFNTLQWGRSCEAAEISSRSLNLEPRAKLQWGRSGEAAEITLK